MKEDNRTPEQIQTDELKKEQTRQRAAEIAAGLSLTTSEDGREVFDVSDYPRNAKGWVIVPDALMATEYKRLPNGCVNEAGTYRAFCGGKLHVLGSEPERDHDIRVAGGKALQASLKHRRTLKEETQLAMASKAPKELAEAVGLQAGATVQEVATAAMARRAMQGDRGAMEYIRDTAGEKPTDKQEIEANIITEADRQLLAQVNARMMGTTTSCVDAEDVTEAGSD